jgi:hypothetical protein
MPKKFSVRSVKLPKCKGLLGLSLPKRRERADYGMKPPNESSRLRHSTPPRGAWVASARIAVKKAWETEFRECWALR